MIRYMRVRLCTDRKKIFKGEIMYYFDNAATTPIFQEVFEEMKLWLEEEFGNPSSMHTLGNRAHTAIEDARKKVASFIKAESDELVFTSGATEADNWVIRGIVSAYQTSKRNEIIISAIEHPAILKTAKELSKQGIIVRVLPVDAKGVVSLEDLKKYISERTILVSVMSVNNELGTIQPIKQIAEICHNYGAFFHTDAVQAIGHIKIDVKALGIDLLSLSGHKLHGPKGIGAMYIRRGIHIKNQLTGGSQEANRRAGTENVPGIVGLGKAIEIINENFDNYNGDIKKYRDMIIETLKSIEGIKINSSSTKCVPNIINVSFKGIDGAMLVQYLDLIGIAVSTGSACASKSLVASHVLEAIGLPYDMINGSIRISIGMMNDERDVLFLQANIKEAVNAIRKISSTTIERKK